MKTARNYYREKYDVPSHLRDESLPKLNLLAVYELMENYHLIKVAESESKNLKQAHVSSNEVAVCEHPKENQIWELNNRNGWCDKCGSPL